MKADAVKDENFFCTTVKFGSTFDNKKKLKLLVSKTLRFKRSQNAFVHVIHIAIWRFVDRKLSRIRFSDGFLFWNVKHVLNIVQEKFSAFTTNAFHAILAHIERAGSKIQILHAVSFLIYFENDFYWRYMLVWIGHCAFLWRNLSCSAAQISTLSL